MSFAGSTVEEAYVILLDTTLLVYFIPYVYMFAAYILLRWRDPIGAVSEDGASNIDAADSTTPASAVPVRGIPANRTLALAFGASGLLTTLFAMGMSIVPPGEGSALLFEIKVLGGAGAFVLVGAVLYAGNR